MSEPGGRATKPVVVLLVVAGLATGAMAFRQMLREYRAIANQPAIDVYGQVPQFTLLRESGDTFSLSALKGRVWVADFIFTRCAGPCPRMTRRMAELQREFGAQANVRFVSISVDPEYDTPEVLREYANAHGADPAQWAFLTGDPDRIQKLSIEGFKLGLGTDDENEHFILHSTRFVLVDGKARIRGYYDESDPENMKKLVADIRKLAAGPDG